MKETRVPAALDPWAYFLVLFPETLMVLDCLLWSSIASNGP
jgi:hypothetical protein